MVKTFKYSVKEPSFTLIKNGIKKIEGRVYKNSFRNIKINDIIIFYNNKINYQVHVIKINKYNNFKNMLLAEGIKNVTPLSNNLEESIAIYRNLYSEDIEKKFGVISLRINN